MHLHILLQALGGEGNGLASEVGGEDTSNDLSLASNAESGALAVVLLDITNGQSAKRDILLVTKWTLRHPGGTSDISERALLLAFQNWVVRSARPERFVCLFWCFDRVLIHTQVR